MAKSLDFTLEIDTRKMEQIIKGSPNAVSDWLDGMAETIKNDIVVNFSDTSPAPPGLPPGVVTGFLRSSIGWAASKPLKRIITAGAEYAAPLEFGVGVFPHPFMLPAFMRIADYFVKGRGLKLVF